MLINELIFLDGATQILGEHKTVSTLESVLQLIGLLILCALIIAASYFVTRFVGTKQAGMQSLGNFTPIDIYRLSQNKYLQLIKIGEKYLVIAVSKDNVSVITELSPEEVHLKDSQKPKSFKEILKGISSKSGEAASETEAVEDGENR